MRHISQPSDLTYRRQAGHLYRLAIGLAGWGLLFYLVSLGQSPVDWVAVSALCALSLGIKRLGIKVTSQVTHSLVGIVDIAALIALGPISGGLVAGVSSSICLLLADDPVCGRSTGEILVSVLFAGGLNALMAAASSWVYLSMGGSIAPANIDARLLPAVISAAVVWFAIDHLGWFLCEYFSSGKQAAHLFMRSVLPYSLLIEFLPLPFALIIVSSIRSGGLLFVFVALFVLGFGVIIHELWDALSGSRRHVRELSAISSLGASMLKARLDVAEVCRLVYEHCQKIVPTPAFAVQLLDTESGELLTPFFATAGRTISGEGMDLGRGAFDLINTTLEPVLYASKGHARLEPLRLGVSTESALYIPIILDDVLMGIISLQSPSEDTFRDADISALQLLASQAAMGLHSAQLYERQQKRTAQLIAIAEVSSKVAAIQELEILFQDTVRLIVDTFGYYHVCILTADTPTQELAFRAASNPYIRRRGLPVSWGRGIMGCSAVAGDTILANDVRLDDRFVHDSALPETRSELAVPLKVEDRIVGVLDVQSNELDAFTDNDVFVLQTLADQVAIAIEDSRLYESQREQAWSTVVLQQVTEAVGQLNDPAEVLNAVSLLSVRLAGFDASVIYVWDDQRANFVVGSLYGWDDSVALARNSRQPVEENSPLLERVRQHGELLVTISSPGLPELFSSLMDGSQVLLLPIGQGRRVLGVLGLVLGREGDVLPRTRSLAVDIANQCALGLDSARLYASQQADAWTTAALLQITRVLGDAIGLSSALEQAARLSVLFAGVSWCAVLQWDDTENFFSHCTASRADGSLLLGYANQLVDQADEQQISTLFSGDSFAVQVDDVAYDAQAQNALVIPLRVRTRLLGVLVGGHVAESLPDSTQVAILQGTAQRISSAIESAELYENSLRQQRLEREIEVATEIQESFLPDTCPQIKGWQIAARWRAARGVGGDFYDFIELGPHLLGIVVADVSDKGVGAALYMALSRTIVRAAAQDAQSPAETLYRANRLLYDENDTGMFVSLFYGVLDTLSGEFRYARAGHNPPLFWDASQGAAVELCPRGVVLGIVDEPIFVEETVELCSEDALLLYTDGVIDAVDLVQEDYGEERLKIAMEATHQTESAEELAQRIDDEVLLYSSGTEAFDDFTLVVLKRVKEN